MEAVEGVAEVAPRPPRSTPTHLTRSFFNTARGRFTGVTALGTSAFSDYSQNALDATYAEFLVVGLVQISQCLDNTPYCQVVVRVGQLDCVGAKARYIVLQSAEPASPLLALAGTFTVIGA